MQSVPQGSAAPSGQAEEGLKLAVTVDTDRVRSHLDEVVRSTVEQARNHLLDDEAGQNAGAGEPRA